MNEYYAIGLEEPHDSSAGHLRHKKWESLEALEHDLNNDDIVKAEEWGYIHIYHCNDGSVPLKHKYIKQWENEKDGD